MVTIRLRKIITGLLISLLPLANVFAAVDVIIDRNPVRMNESFQLVFEADETPDEVPDFSVLEQFFRLVSNHQSNSISIINGDYQRSVKWTLQLVPKQAGEFVVPAISIGDEKTEPMQISVLAANQEQSVDNSEVFLELELEPDEAYVQSQIIVKQRLLARVKVSSIRFSDLDFGESNVLVEQLGQDKQYQQRINGQVYAVWERTLAIYPQQSGELTIQPWIAEVRFPFTSNSVFNFFDSGGDRKRFESTPQSLTVFPPEAGVFPWLPTPDLELSETFTEPTHSLVAGVPFTRTITIEAENLTAIQLPEISIPTIDGIKHYPDQPSLDNRRTASGINGVREQKVAFVPTVPGRFQLPEVSLNWWNLKTGQVETARLPATDIIVLPSAEEQANPPVSVSPQQNTTTSDEIASSLAPANQFWVWLSLFLAVGWLLSGLFWWWQKKQEQHKQEGDIQFTKGKFKSLHQQLKKACLANDATAVKACLPEWANGLTDSDRYTYLQQLETAFGSDFSEQINQLNASQYGKETTPWDGQILWSICEQLARNVNKGEQENVVGLAPLNPA